MDSPKHSKKKKRIVLTNVGFFRVEDGQLLFHLKLYVETLNKLWQREGVWPNRYFYMKVDVFFFSKCYNLIFTIHKETKWAARKLARKLMVVAIERPGIEQ